MTFQRVTPIKKIEINYFENILVWLLVEVQNNYNRDREERQKKRNERKTEAGRNGESRKEEETESYFR